MRLSLSVAPAEEPVTLTEAKVHLRVGEDVGEEDALIAGHITAARVEAERILGRSLVSQSWEGKMDSFPDDDALTLPMAPLRSVTSIKYVDTDGVEQTVSSADYTVDTSGVVGRVYLNYGKSWPGIRSEYNAVRVVFVAGYGDAGSVPEDVRSWILLRVADRYEHRESIVVGTIATKLPELGGLLMGDRLGF